MKTLKQYWHWVRIPLCKNSAIYLSLILQIRSWKRYYFQLWSRQAIWMSDALPSWTRKWHLSLLSSSYKIIWKKSFLGLLKKNLITSQSALLVILVEELRASVAKRTKEEVPLNQVIIVRVAQYKSKVLATEIAHTCHYSWDFHDLNGRLL